ncbi:PQQ-binding-like beta-propeller repeat protein [Sphingomonas sp. 28-63-12]|uniref:outer membrane protein assembly factor BamB family protein n=1 Tax=Sphingomonas sp. 28-63-12 TaxID=1970434 RepID=UPI000BC702C9|nr:MAG: hypothetical protein B7Y47_09665 [Sphingomonas sp. 28-63-12]
MTKAYDAATGKPLWAYDLKVPKEILVKACCDAVNRGVAAWHDKVYVGTLDGRLVVLDARTGRSAIVPAAMDDKTRIPFVSVPGTAGAHSWQPMSFSFKTGLVDILVNEAGFPYAAAGKDWKPRDIGFDTGIDPAKTAMPADTPTREGARKATIGKLIAWNPVTQSAAWSVAYPGPSNGGTLATAGNLVFQGTASGSFNAYTADHGRRLWSAPTQTGVIAAPMTYAVKGEQFVAIMVGWGGMWDIAAGVLANKSGSVRNVSRPLVFKLGAKASLPPAPLETKRTLDPPAVTGTSAQIADGATEDKVLEAGRVASK